MALYALGNAEPRIHGDAYVHPDATIIGDVTIGAGSSVWPHALLVAEDAAIVVADRTSVQDNALVMTADGRGVRIGCSTIVGHLARLFGCTIGDDSLIGVGAVLAVGSSVGNGAIVGAGTHVDVNVQVPSGALAIGSPLQIRPGAADIERHVRPGAERYVERVRQYRTTLRRVG
jgi:carbonic anhydrase/acetyltransferase-like protein (isoleucine patch superfamily)